MKRARIWYTFPSREYVKEAVLSSLSDTLETYIESVEEGDEDVNPQEGCVVINFAFLLREESRGFPILVLEDGPVFISEDPVSLDEFVSAMKALQSMKALPEKLWGLRIRADGENVCLTLPGGREIQVARKRFAQIIRTSLKNLEAVLNGKPVRMEWLKLKPKPPSQQELGELREILSKPEKLLDEYEVQVYGSTYVLEAFVNLEWYVEELKELRDFVVRGRLPPEEWRVKRDLDSEIKRLSSSGLKSPEDRGRFKELRALKRFSAGAVPPFVRFTLSTYDPFEVVYVANAGNDEFLLAFILYSGMAVKVRRDVLLRAIDDAIAEAEREIERVKG